MNTAAFVQPQPRNGRPPVPTVVLAPAELAPSELAQVLSPSQARTFLECAAKWYFKYLRGLPDPPSSSMAVGKAGHEAIGKSMAQKILTKRDLPVEDVVASFERAWKETSAEVEFREEDTPGELRELGKSLVTLYMREAAPAIQPAHVELPVAGKIGGVNVRGFIDLVDVDGVVIDLKTAAKKPNIISPDYRLQLTTYDLLCPVSRGKARLDTMVKTRTVALVQQSTDITPADVQYAETIYPMVQDAIKDGIFYPRRSSWMCSRRNCPYWRACEKEYGGEVEK
jgi:hypothetical protein